MECYSKLDPERAYDQVSQLLRYEPETGKLFWKERPLAFFRTVWACRVWNSVYSGKEAFTTVSTSGYKAGGIFGVRYAAHRVIWLLTTGAWPVNNIDHIDGDRANNRFGNLRDATNTENMRNAKLRSDNTTGVLGVSWDSYKRRWRATVTLNGKSKELGRFHSFEQAVAAREAANLEYGFSARHGSRESPALTKENQQ